MYEKQMNVKQQTMYYINVLITLFYEIENTRRIIRRNYLKMIDGMFGHGECGLWLRRERAFLSEYR